MTKDILFKYGSLKLTIAEAEEELEMIKEQALKAFQELRGDNDQLALTELPGCAFSVQKRKTWKYSDLCKDMEKKYKEQKKLEEQLGPENGGATFTEKDSLVFLTAKE